KAIKAGDFTAIEKFFARATGLRVESVKSFTDHGQSGIRVEFAQGGRLSIVQTVNGATVKAEKVGKAGDGRSRAMSKKISQAGARWVRAQRPPLGWKTVFIVFTAFTLILGVSLAFWLTPLYYPNIAWTILDAVSMIARYARIFFPIPMIYFEFMMILLVSSGIGFTTTTLLRRALVRRMDRAEIPKHRYGLAPIISRNRQVNMKDMLPKPMNSWAFFLKRPNGTLEVYRGVELLPPVVQVFFYARDMIVASYNIKVKFMPRFVSGILIGLVRGALGPILNTPRYVWILLRYLVESLLPYRAPPAVAGTAISMDQLRGVYDVSAGGSFHIVTGIITVVPDGDGIKVRLPDGQIITIRFMRYNSFGNPDPHAGPLSSAEVQKDIARYAGKLTPQQVIDAGRKGKEEAVRLLLPGTPVILLLHYRNGKPVLAVGGRHVADGYIIDPDRPDRRVLITDKLKERMGGPDAENVTWDNPYAHMSADAQTLPSYIQGDALEGPAGQRLITVSNRITPWLWRFWFVANVAALIYLLPLLPAGYPILKILLFSAAWFNFGIGHYYGGAVLKLVSAIWNALKAIGRRFSTSARPVVQAGLPAAAVSAATPNAAMSPTDIEDLYNRTIEVLKTGRGWDQNDLAGTVRTLVGWDQLLPLYRRLGVNPSEILEAWMERHQAGVNVFGISKPNTQINSPVRLPENVEGTLLRQGSYNSLDDKIKRLLERRVAAMLGLKKKPGRGETLEIGTLSGAQIKAYLDGGETGDPAFKLLMQDKTREQWLWRMAIEEGWADDMIKAMTLLAGFVSQMRKQFHDTQTLVISPLSLFEVIDWAKATHMGEKPENWKGPLNLRLMLIDEATQQGFQKTNVPAARRAPQQVDPRTIPDAVGFFGTRVNVSATRVGGEWLRNTTNSDEVNPLRYEFLHGITAFGGLMKQLRHHGDWHVRDDLHLMAASFFRSLGTSRGVDLGTRLVRFVLRHTGSSSVATDVGTEWGRQISQEDAGLARDLAARIQIRNLFARAALTHTPSRGAPPVGGILWGKTVGADEALAAVERTSFLSEDRGRTQLLGVLRQALSAEQTSHDDVFILPWGETHNRIEVRVRLAQRAPPLPGDSSDLFRWGSILRAGPMSQAAHVDRYDLILNTELLKLTDQQLAAVVQTYFARIQQLSQGSSFETVRKKPIVDSEGRILPSLRELSQGLELRRFQGYLPQWVEMDADGWLNVASQEDVLRAAQGMLTYWKMETPDESRPILIGYSTEAHRDLAAQVARLAAANGRRVLLASQPGSVNSLQQSPQDAAGRFYIGNGAVRFLGAEGSVFDKTYLVPDKLNLAVSLTREYLTTDAQGHLIDSVDLPEAAADAPRVEKPKGKEARAYPAQDNTRLPGLFTWTNLIYATVFLGLLILAATIFIWNPAVHLQITGLPWLSRITRYGTFFMIRGITAVITFIVNYFFMAFVGILQYVFFYLLTQRKLIRQMDEKQDIAPIDLPPEIARFPEFNITEDPSTLKEKPLVKLGENGRVYVNHRALGIAYAMFQQSRWVHLIHTATFGLVKKETLGRMRLLLFFESALAQAKQDSFLAPIQQIPLLGMFTRRGGRYSWLIQGILWQPFLIVRGFFRSIKMWFVPEAAALGESLAYTSLPTDLAQKGFTLHYGCVR
ncbi:MAG TPA: hypothetical protein P5079_09545, partial [Elusimicrobiota bacterium]|nr:hypothetical protein [Elusimicrobiota bacterium]